jgi:hypothetical protein
MNETFLKNNDPNLNHLSRQYLTDTSPESPLCNNNNNNTSSSKLADRHMVMSRSNSSSSISSMLSDDEQLHNPNHNEIDMNNNNNTNTNNGVSHRAQVAAFFAEILNDHVDCSNAKNEKNHFYCTHCLVEFDSNSEFRAHCKANIPSCEHREHYSFVNPNCEEFIVDDLSSPRAILVLLMERKMKARFMGRYSHDLLVVNEQLALCLEELNDDYDNIADDDDGDHDDDDSNSQFSLQSSTNGHEDLSLLFIDYSIIQFSRVVGLLQELYSSVRRCFKQNDINNSGLYLGSKTRLTFNDEHRDGGMYFYSRFLIFITIYAWKLVRKKNSKTFASSFYFIFCPHTTE